MPYRKRELCSAALDVCIRILRENSLYWKTRKMCDNDHDDMPLKLAKPKLLKTAETTRLSGLCVSFVRVSATYAKIARATKSARRLLAKF